LLAPTDRDFLTEDRLANFADQAGNGADATDLEAVPLTAQVRRDAAPVLAPRAQPCGRAGRPRDRDVNGSGEESPGDQVLGV